jgi:two-component system, chemotaxis family, protein-glutamate methylesterase/glutaminase
MTCVNTTPRPVTRVMIVDDSAVVRGFIVRILESDPSIEITATCSNGQAAVMQIARRMADVVILDIEMPVMDGLSALPKLLAAAPQARVIMASTLTQKNAEISLEALARGAADYIPKPTASQLNGNADFRRELLAKVAALGRRTGDNIPTVAIMPAREARPASRLRTAARLNPKIIAIGSSTGGPQALLTLVKDLPKEIDVPIVIAQHMPAKFTEVLAQHLARLSGRPSAEAIDGAEICAGGIYVAPGNHHFEVARDGSRLTARLTKAPAENFCRPSVNPLFRSVAQVFGAQCVGVMLTGMGCDGLDGARRIALAGGAMIAQDEQSSVVWGMPGAVANAGLCSAVLPLSAIAFHLGALFSEGRR